jgi:hypothetical protein
MLKQLTNSARIVVLAMVAAIVIVALIEAMGLNLVSLAE